VSSGTEQFELNGRTSDLREEAAFFFNRIGFLTTPPGFLVVFFSHNRKMSYHRNYEQDCFAE
jgi:hypothetical protein